MLKRTSVAIRVLGCLAGLAMSVLPTAAQTIIGPIVKHDVHHDLSLPLRDMAKNAPRAVHVKHEAEPWRRIPLPAGMEANVEDPVLQRVTVPYTPTVGTSFEGIGQGQYGFSVASAPPDTNGAVGATQYVQMVNSDYAVFSKSNGALVLGPVAINTLWSGFGGGCETNNDGDPVVLYDKISNRWVLTQFSVSTTPYLQCVAVSTTSDATGTYNRYSFSYSNFDDYPKMGLWPDGYYTTFNMFSGNTFLGADSCAYDKSKMLTGAAATQVCFQQSSAVGGLLPSDMDGTTQPPAGSPNYQIYYGTNSLQLYKFHVDFTTPSNSTYTGPTNISVAAFSAVCGGGTCIPQKGTTQQLDSLADRLMFRLAYRNFGSHESLVTNHSVTAGSSGGVRWYEIQNPNGTPTVAQQGTFAPDSSYRWLGSIAMDQAGDIALGYSLSSSSINPSIYFTGRVPTDPSGTMESEVNIVSGTGSQTGSSLSRWGDYSAMSVDPVDDCTFWYTTEYIKTNGAFNWNTRIANFKFPSCGTVASPDFTLSDSPSSLTVTQGGSGNSTITVNPINGFTGSVSLSASGLPSGVTATFSPATITSSGGLTINASSTATTGTSTVTITGTSGALTHTTTLTLTVNAAAAKDYSLTIFPTSASITQGGANVTGSVTVNPINGFTGSVALSASGVPSGVTVTFSPTSTTTTSTLTLSANATATVGTFTVTITGTSGALSHSGTISLTVSSSGGGGGSQTAVYSSTLKAPQCATAGSSCDSGPTLLLGRANLSGGAEPNQPNTINSTCADGTSGTFHSDESNDRIVVATTDGTTFAPGKTVKITATVWAYSGNTSDALDLYYAANASSPTWVFITTIVPPAAGAQALSANYTLPTGTLQAVRAVFRYLGSASSCTTGAYDDHDDLIFATGTAAPSFTLSAAPSSLSVTQGASGTSTITVNPTGGFSSSVALSASGLPTGVTASFSPASTTSTSTLTFTASSTAATGAKTVTVTGVSGSITQTTSITLTVNASGGGGAQTAVYSSTYKAPQCATVGSSCDSGASLLNGRGTISGGVETNHPNTINNSCTDGNSGTYHSDESNDRLVIASTDGTPLTHGKTAKVTATVYAWNTGSSDALDLYYSASATTPSWVYITTIVPPVGGAQALSATFTLPTGSVQAVRANFRYTGSASSCSTGTYDDHDDLVFAVQ